MLPVFELLSLFIGSFLVGLRSLVLVFFGVCVLLMLGFLCLVWEGREAVAGSFFLAKP
jgi:hypothetical protein